MLNQVKTILLLGSLSVILITLGGVLGGESGIIFAFIVSLFINGISYFFSDKIALKMSGAKPLGKAEGKKIYDMVEELSRSMNMPMPKLYITGSHQANAFATGRSPSHASVAVTKGILEILSDEELKGVLAHELSHVNNRDILIASIAAVLAGTISFLANMALFSGRSNKLGAFGIIIAILIPIAASIIQLAVSRQREYGADLSGAKIMGDGKPLASALLAIHASAKRTPMRTNPALSSLYIENPLGGIHSGLANLFSTHPPVEERIKKLQNI